MNMIAAVIFDMDGVIFDSETICRYSWRQLADEYHLNHIEDNFLKCTGTNKLETRRIMLQEYGEDFPYDEFTEKASAIFHQYVAEHGLPLKKGVMELLQSLRHQKIGIGLASSTRLAVVEAELKEAGIYEYFDAVIGGDLLKKSKPEPDIYLMACEALDVFPEQAYAIEDSYNGIRSAYRAGMKPIMVPDLLMPTPEMEEKSIRIMDNLLLVKEYLEKQIKECK